MYPLDACCIPYLLITKSAYICTSWSSVKHFRRARRCKRAPPSMWTRCGNCVSRCLDSDYMLSENSSLFFIYRTMYAFFEVHDLFSSEFINFLSTTHLLIARTPRVLDYMLKRSQTSVIWGSSLTALCAKQSCIHFSFAFTPLDNVTFRLEQYVFKN